MTKPGLEPRFFCLQTLAHDRKASSGEGPCLVLPLAFPLGPHHSDSHRVLPCVWSEVTHFFIGSTNSLLTHCVEAQCSKSAFRESPVSPAWFLCAIWGGDIWTISLNIPKEAPQASLSSLRSWLISLVAEAFSDRPSSNRIPTQNPLPFLAGKKSQRREIHHSRCFDSQGGISAKFQNCLYLSPCLCSQRSGKGDVGVRVGVWDG